MRNNIKLSPKNLITINKPNRPISNIHLAYYGPSLPPSSSTFKPETERPHLRQLQTLPPHSIAELLASPILFLQGESIAIPLFNSDNQFPLSQPLQFPLQLLCQFSLQFLLNSMVFFFLKDQSPNFVGMDVSRRWLLATVLRADQVPFSALCYRRLNHWFCGFCSVASEMKSKLMASLLEKWYLMKFWSELLASIDLVCYGSALKSYQLAQIN